MHSFNSKWIEIPSINNRTFTKLVKFKKSYNVFDEDYIFVTLILSNLMKISNCIKCVFTTKIKC